MSPNVPPSHLFPKIIDGTAAGLRSAWSGLKIMHRIILTRSELSMDEADGAWFSAAAG
jgi:hypothetical protein